MAKPLKKSKVQKPIALFTSAQLAAKTIRASQIYALWVEVLGRHIKDVNDDPNDYNIPNVIAYADFLNHTPQFSRYHLSLQPIDVDGVQSMGDLGGAIVRNFQDNGWTVTPN